MQALYIKYGVRATEGSSWYTFVYKYIEILENIERNY